MRRDECMCPCHTNPGMLHIVACCEGDPILDLRMEENLVERVAMAIGSNAGEPLMWPFGEMPSENVKEKLRNMARAAIAAIASQRS